MKRIELLSPITGRVVPIEDVPDPVFAEKMLGDGLAIEPAEGLGVAPISGKLVVFHSAGHAFAVSGPEGVEVAVHLGLDTVTLAGAPFERLAEVGDDVEAGQPIVRMDIEAIRAAGLNPLSPIFLPQLDEAWTMSKTASATVRAGRDWLLRIERAETAAAGKAESLETGPASQADVIIRNPTGLHARPAGQFVRQAQAFRAEIGIENLDTGAGPVDAKRLLAVMGAGMAMGTRARLSANGPDAEQAISTLTRLIEHDLPEAEEALKVAQQAAAAAAQPAHAPARAGHLARPAATSGLHVKAVAAAPGMAVGPVWRYRSRSPEGDGAQLGEAATAPRGDGGVKALEAAAGKAAEQLAGLSAAVAATGRPDDAAIFDAQSLIAMDPGLLGEARGRIEQGADPATAITGAAAAAAEELAALNDELLAARAADVRDVGARIVRILRGETLELPKEPSIAVADDLPPSITAEIPRGFLLGIALAGGSRTAHAVILARGLGIPCVVGAAGLLEAVDAASAPAAGAAAAGPAAAGEARQGVSVAVDGVEGEVIVDPSDREIEAIERREAALAESSRRASSLRERPAATAEGERVALVANIGTPDDAPRALEARAEGVGLFRTEFLYMKRQTPPTEHEQVLAYRRVLSAFGPERPVVVRLADIGGDKGIPYLGLPAEANPFLGVRALRLAYRSHDLLRTQLRAIWQAAALAGVTPHVMAPMVATVADVELLVSLRDEAREDVVSAGLPCADSMVTGIMVEIPSAALLARELAPRIDFFSIGTNDLTQYTMAADRGNATLSSLQDALHPAVLRLIKGVVEGADASGIPVAVCGELAGDPAGALVLVGLGVDELSADAGSLDAVRAALAAVTRVELTELAKRSLAAFDAETVRGLAKPLLSRVAG